MTVKEFQEQIKAGIPDVLPAPKPYDPTINHAPKRKEILTEEERVLAIRNALRYFPAKHHEVLAREFAEELHKYGRIYMYRFRPDYEMYARPIEEYPHKSRQAAAIMVMIQNNLDKAVAQHPHELITYGGNGAVFQNWAQYLLTMQYLSQMTDDQTLVMYSGHPMGLFPSHPDAPRVVVTNGMVIPNYSKPDDWERMNALGVSQYGQMTAGSYMYIGPQGIVHGTTITVMNAARKRFTADRRDARGMLFVSSGLGGMSGAQPKAGTISGVVSVIAEINPKAAQKRHEQGWVDELHEALDELIPRIRQAVKAKEVVSMAYVGNVVDLWERLAAEEIPVDLGSDQTSLHNPWAGGYYPVGLSYEASNKMMAEEPARFRECVQESLRRQVDAINRLTYKDKEKYKRAIFIHVDSRGHKDQVDVFFYHSPGSKLGKRLTENIHKTFERKYDKHQPNRGFRGTVSERSLYVLKKSNPAAAFLELGNIQNERDRKRLVIPSNRQALADWICQGIIKDFKGQR
mgnify:CR=1 FL=1